MSKFSKGFFSVALLVILASSVFAQQAQPTTMVSAKHRQILASTSGEGVRFSTLGELLQMRLEVIGPSGQVVYNTEIRAGNVIDWSGVDLQGRRLSDGTYVCVIAVKDADGEEIRRQAIAVLGQQQTSLKRMDKSQLALAQAQAAADIPDEENSLTIVEPGQAAATIIAAHDGNTAQLVSGSGGLVIGSGNFFAAKVLEQVRITAEGQVGIGMTPQVKLDVAGRIRASEGIVFPDGSVQLSASRKTFGAASLRPGHTNSTQGQDAMVPDTSGTGTTGKLPKWQDGPNGVLADSNLTETGSGNTISVGVNGTPSPNFRLDVNGSFRVRGADAGFNLEGASNGTVWLFQSFDADGHFRIFGQDNVTPGAERLTISMSTGNIGMGAVPPAHTKLLIAGDIRSGFGIPGTPTGMPGTGGRFIALNPNNQAAVVQLDWVNDGTKDWPRIRYGGSGTGATNGFQIQGPANVVKLTVLESGNVGIGTVTPAAKLDVAGNINSSTHYDIGGDSVLSNGGSSNLFVGVGAGASNIAGSNTFVGFNAGNNNTTGITNSFFGSFAGLNNADGVFNSFFGSAAGRFNVGGHNNSFFGMNSGINTTSGSFNSFFGQAAGNDNTDGFQNSYFGNNTGLHSIGSSNSFFGALAGNASINIDNSSFLGVLTQGADGIRNATAIGFRAKVTQSNSLVLGSILGTNGCTAAANCDSVKVGIGTTAPQVALDVVGKSQFSDNVQMGTFTETNAAHSKLHVEGSFSSGLLPGDHVATIQNSSTATLTPVLALQVASSRISNSGARYITFFRGSVDAGNIQGDDNGGISLHSIDADYAEWLPRLTLNEKTQPGDIVGLYGGRITRRTQRADRVMVVSTAPIVLGNDPGENAHTGYERIAFIGQVPVRVRGVVSAGDFVIASGADDGTGVAVSPECITSAQFAQVVGQAWESSSDAGVKPVRTAIGLIQHDPTINRLLDLNRQQSAQIAALSARLTAIESRLNRRTNGHRFAVKH